MWGSVLGQSEAYKDVKILCKYDLWLCYGVMIGALTLNTTPVYVLVLSLQTKHVLHDISIYGYQLAYAIPPFSNCLQAAARGSLLTCWSRICSYLTAILLTSADNRCQCAGILSLQACGMPNVPPPLQPFFIIGSVVVPAGMLIALVATCLWSVQAKGLVSNLNHLQRKLVEFIGKQVRTVVLTVSRACSVPIVVLCYTGLEAATFRARSKQCVWKNLHCCAPESSGLACGCLVGLHIGIHMLHRAINVAAFY